MKKVLINHTIENRKARYDYYIDETIECGIELHGNEVKSIREGTASIKEAWVSIENEQIFIKKMFINSWETANKYDVDETRERKLLIHKREIHELKVKIQRDGYTIIPLKVYFNENGKCKVLIAVAKGKHNYDKRKVAKDRQTKKDIDRALKKIG